MFDHSLIHEQQSISNIDMQNSLGSFIFHKCGNSRVGFSSLNDDGGHKATVKRVSFFMSASGLHSWWLDGGGFGLLGSIVTSLLTCIQPPFLFSSRKGEQLRHGGSL